MTKNLLYSQCDVCFVVYLTVSLRPSNTDFVGNTFERGMAKPASVLPGTDVSLVATLLDTDDLKVTYDK